MQGFYYLKFTIFQIQSNKSAVKIGRTFSISSKRSIKMNISLLRNKHDQVRYKYEHCNLYCLMNDKCVYQISYHITRMLIVSFQL